MILLMCRLRVQIEQAAWVGHHLARWCCTTHCTRTAYVSRTRLWIRGSENLLLVVPAKTKKGEGED